jgi:nickel-type superoxide dismutase maturation protease
MLLLSKFKVLGHSMEPQLKNQNTILVSSFPYLFKSPKINDIVAFEDKKRNIMIKRITRIRNNKFFLAGDNKKDSFDSRNFGEISKNQILGKVIYKF